MAAKKNDPTGDAKDITLHDVVVHMEYMEQRLSSEIKSLSSKVIKNSEDIKANSAAIQSLEIKFTARMDALEEDLVATVKDTYRIRQHVGIAGRAED